MFVSVNLNVSVCVRVGGYNAKQTQIHQTRIQLCQQDGHAYNLKFWKKIFICYVDIDEIEYICVAYMRNNMQVCYIVNRNGFEQEMDMA